MIMLAHMCAPLLLYSFTAPIQSSIPHNLFSANFPNEIPPTSQMEFCHLPKWNSAIFPNEIPPTSQMEFCHLPK